LAQHLAAHVSEREPHLPARRGARHRPG
jgi:hypothetical protein